MASKVMKDASELRDELAARFCRAERVALLAVGSELRNDDAVGMMIGEALLTDTPDRLQVFLGSSAPENCTGTIRRYAPNLLVVVDAAELGQAPGTAFLVEAEEIAGTTFSTHMLPLVVILRYMLDSCPGCDLLVVGIEPRDISFGMERSPEIERAAASVAQAFRDALAAR